LEKEKPNPENILVQGLMPWNPEHYGMKPKIIHTQTFSCEDDHPIVWYTFDNKVDSTDKTNKGYVVCEYCYTKFVYEPKKKLLPLKDHWIPGLTERPTQKDFYDKVQEEKKLLNMSMKESIKQKEERTHSEEMQDKLEPITNYVNKILKGSG
jgi:uncharacterized Zn-finger protein